ncbi:Bromodomain-containing protein 9 [Nymphon striatum]|nr:Bromodomain-containing protein 9 [Nymphon striatum]
MSSQKQKVPENGDVSLKTARCSAQQVAAILDSDDEETLGFDEDYPSDELETDSDDNVDNDNDSESDSDNENPVDRLPVRPVIGHNFDSGWNKKYFGVNKHLDNITDCVVVEKPLRLVLKVGGGGASRGGTPSSDYNGDSSSVSVKAEPSTSCQEVEPTYYSEQTADSNSITLRASEKHKKSKKKKKKKSSDKDKEKKHKHHHRHRHHHHHHTPEKKVELQEDKQNPPVNEDSNQGSAILGEPEVMDQSLCQQVEEMDTSIPAAPDSVVVSPIIASIDKTDEKSLHILITSLFKSLQKKDLDQFFAWPVSDVIAPGYSTIIPNPMDFSSMKQKIDKHEYSTIDEFKSDVKLICDNCMTYNQRETVYYKSAKKLLHAANKMMSKDKLLMLKKSLIVTEQIPTDETTLETAAITNTAPSDIPVAPVVTPPPTPLLPPPPTPPPTTTTESSNIVVEPPTKRLKPTPCVVNLFPVDVSSIVSSRAKPGPAPSQVTLNTNNLKPVETVVKKSPEDIEAEKILLEAQAAAKCAREKISLRRPNNNLAYLTQKENGTTTLNIINPDSSKHSEREVTFGMVMDKLKSGTGTLNAPKEDKRNIVKPVHQLEFGSYCSFAPTFDSTFANLNKEETNLMHSTYGDELGVQYAKSFLKFTENAEFALAMAENILNRATNGNHNKVSNMLKEKKKLEEELQATNEKSNSSDFENLDDSEVQKKLDRNAKLLQDLNNLQNERLSQKLPSHLSHIAPASEREVQLALQVQDQLKELAMQVFETLYLMHLQGISPAQMLLEKPWVPFHYESSDDCKSLTRVRAVRRGGKLAKLVESSDDESLETSSRSKCRATRDERIQYVIVIFGGVVQGAYADNTAIIAKVNNSLDIENSQPQMGYLVK